MQTIHVGRPGREGGGSTVRYEEVHWGQGIPDQVLYFLSSLNGIHSIPGVVYFSRLILQQDNGIPLGVK